MAAKAGKKEGGLKTIVRLIFASAPVRAVTRIFLCVASWISRAASVLRTQAIFDGPNRPICHWSVTVKYPENITFGEGVVIGPNTSLGAKGGVTFGDHVRISEGVMIETATLDFRGAPPYPHIAKPIVLERGVWVGARAIILGGVTVREGSVIGAGAVVTRSVPPNTVLVGAAGDTRPKQSGKTYRLAQ